MFFPSLSCFWSWYLSKQQKGKLEQRHISQVLTLLCQSPLEPDVRRHHGLGRGDSLQSMKSHTQMTGDSFLPITVCHGSPRKISEKLLPDSENTYFIMESNSTDYILCGHTHIQGKIIHNGKIVLNAGSVGVPLHSNGKAQFMILRGLQGSWDYEFVSLEYDMENV